MSIESERVLKNALIVVLLYMKVHLLYQDVTIRLKSVQTVELEKLLRIYQIRDFRHDNKKDKAISKAFCQYR